MAQSGGLEGPISALSEFLRRRPEQDLVDADSLGFVDGEGADATDVQFLVDQE
jgi:hypothetical protein